MTPRNKYLLHRVYYLLRHEQHAFIFKSLRTDEGWCDKEFICINIKGNDTPIRTLIHECLHYLYDWSESMVVSKEKSIYHQLTIDQIKYLYKLLVDLM